MKKCKTTITGRIEAKVTVKPVTKEGKKTIVINECPQTPKVRIVIP